MTKGIKLRKKGHSNMNDKTQNEKWLRKFADKEDEFPSVTAGTKTIIRETQDNPEQIQKHLENMDDETMAALIETMMQFSQETYAFYTDPSMGTKHAAEAFCMMKKIMTPGYKKTTATVTTTNSKYEQN